MTTRTKAIRWAEMLALFVGGPLLLHQLPGILGGGRLFVFLMLMGLACGVGLYFDKQFDRKKLWNASAIPDAIGWVVLRWVFCSVLLVALFGLFAGRELPGLSIAVPTGLFGIFRIDDAFMKWLPLLILFFYPWMSVYPQNLIFRAYFIQRYKPILGGGWLMILVNAAAFSFGHVMFNNWVVLVLTFCGGIIFTRTYLRTDSLLLTVIEHAMYGVFCFYIGVGVFLLYGGAG